jgi:hypothetical protein
METIVNYYRESVQFYYYRDLSPEFLYEIGKQLAQTSNVSCL